MVFLKNTIYIVLPVLVFFNSCSKFGSDKSERAGKLLDGKDNVIYHSVENPGKWEDEVIDHVPVTTIEYGKEFRTIKVEIAFPATSEPLHYIEAIILMDHNRKELQKVSFHKGNKTPTAIFKLPWDYKSFVYVISKCNLHDMWEKKIVWDR